MQTNPRQLGLLLIPGGVKQRAESSILAKLQKDPQLIDNIHQFEDGILPDNKEAGELALTKYQ